MKSIYFDNAATSWPKPKSVLRAMEDFFRHGGGNPGRSGHRRSIDAARAVVETRELLARLFGVRDSARIVFTKNATEALNLAIYGLAERGKRIVTTSMEHNSVLRPLNHLMKDGYEVVSVPGDRTGRVDSEALGDALKAGTNLVVITHASNVTGAINHIAPIGGMCRERGISLLVDAAQTAGCVPIDVEEMGVDYLAFSGHKGLLGPQGTGGLYIGGDRLREPLLRGGTGSLSDRAEQPDFFPDRFESGTLNVIGIAGLGAGVRCVMERGVAEIGSHESAILHILLQELSNDDRLVLYGPVAAGEGFEARTGLGSGPGLDQTGVLSLNIRGISPSKVGQALDGEYGIQTRIGLHCAPTAHRTIGTFPDGTVRLSWGPFTTEREARAVIRAIRGIADRFGGTALASG